MTPQPLNGRKVTVARLHNATHITGAGNIGPMIDRKSKSFIEMEASTVGIFLSGKDPVTGSPFEAFIPFGMIQCIEFEAK